MTFHVIVVGKVPLTIQMLGQIMPLLNLVGDMAQRMMDQDLRLICASRVLMM